MSDAIAGAEDSVEIRRWAMLHIDFLRRRLPFANGELLRGAKDDHSLKARRRSAAWDDTCFDAVVRRTA